MRSISMYQEKCNVLKAQKCLKTPQKSGCHFFSRPLFLVKHLLPSIPRCDHRSTLSGSAPPWPFLSWVAAADTPLVSELLGLLPSQPSPCCSRVIFLKCKMIMHHFCLSGSLLPSPSFLTYKTLN